MKIEKKLKNPAFELEFTNVNSDQKKIKDQNRNPAGKKESRHSAKVWITGAGCGDVSLLSQKAKDVLLKADIVFCDDLVHPSIRNLAKKAEIIYTGKRKGKPSISQQEIENLLLDAAGKYRNIVRLKGGDPLVFGRGMEEAQFLKEHGIDYEIICGISSVSGILTRHHIPLTHRDHASSFTVITGHPKKDSDKEEDWNVLAGLKGTIVVLMGISNARDICQNLIAAGKDPQTPAAVCASVDITKPSGLLSTLEELPEKIETANIKSPGILVIGENAQFFKLPQKPLIAGIAGSGYFCKKIEKKIRKSMPDFAFECISVLDGIYENDPDQIKKALQEKPDWLVFTSVHGVKLLLKYLKEHNQDIRTLSGIKIACIGKQCAKPFVKAGIFADLISKTPTVAALADELLAQIKPDETIALLQSANGNPVLKKRLETKANVKVYPLYTLHYEKAENPEPCDYLAFGSSQAVIHFHTLYPSWTFSAIPFCLSQVSGSVFEKLYGFAPQLPKKISAASLAKAMIKQTHKQ